MGLNDTVCPHVVVYKEFQPMAMGLYDTVCPHVVV